MRLFRENVFLKVGTALILIVAIGAVLNLKSEQIFLSCIFNSVAALD